jgi:uroporphyrinogen III methyltransferase/synthase
MDLLGKTILITRASSQSDTLRNSLESAGARVIESPAIQIVPLEDWSEVDRVVANLHTYDWLIFTSANAVQHFMPRVQKAGTTLSVPIAVVGTSTARSLERWGLVASLVPSSFRAEGLLGAFPSELPGLRMLFPRAETARETLPEELRRRGATVDVLPVYRTTKSSTGLLDIAVTLSQERVDAVVFASPSAVRYFSEVLAENLDSTLGPIPIAAIGPVVREAVESFGLKVSIQPEQATMADLTQAICRYFSSSRADT